MHEENDDEPRLETMGEFFKRMIPEFERTIIVNSAETYFEKLKLISEYYKSNESNILAKFQKSKVHFYDVYPIDWSIIFTPIESLAWSSIRNKGRMVLYPQYPVLNYHLDFANPGLKIALELDGKDFHDQEKDLIRDNKLRALGWTIYRISGKEMNRNDYKNFYALREEGIDDLWDMEEEINYWIRDTGDGVIEAIKQIHFENNHEYKSEIGMRFITHCYNTLEEHQLTEQTIKRRREF
jgi:hypothetical protein